MLIFLYFRERMWFYIVCIGILVYFLSKRFLETLLLPHDADRHVLVTGCDTGFGNLLAKHLEKLGIRVFACCLTEQAQEDFRSHCSRNVIPLALDVTKEESVQNCLKFVKEKLGDKGLVSLISITLKIMYIILLLFLHVECELFVVLSFANFK